MKFAALALALLLAVGTHGAALQADAPSQLEHARAAAAVYMDQLKNSLLKSLDQLDSTSYKDSKADIAQNIENAFTNLKVMQARVSPMTDSLVSTFSEATAEFRASAQADLDNLKTDLLPKVESLRDILVNHLTQYKTILTPIVDEHSAKHQELMTDLKTKMEPAVQQLQQAFSTNVEETKAALTPILEALRTKIDERLVEIRALVVPYVEEYKEQLKTTINNAQSMTPEELQNLRQKIMPATENIKNSFQSIFEAVAEMFNKQ